MTRREWLAGWLWFWPERKRRRLAGIEFEVIRRGRGPRRYLVIHGDERTGRAVLLARRFSGVAYLVASAGRLVWLGGARIDPNRLFSRAGAERSLRRLNPDMAPERLWQILDRLDRERPALVRALLPPRGGLLIALHNNSSGYSVRNEVPLSDQVALNDEPNPHDFVLATAPEDFARLARGPYNVVLQNRRPDFDDGSLSRLAARLGARYLNIEAGMWAGKKQAAMLDWVEATLPPGRRENSVRIAGR